MRECDHPNMTASNKIPLMPPPPTYHGTAEALQSKATSTAGKNAVTKITTAVSSSKQHDSAI